MSVQCEEAADKINKDQECVKTPYNMGKLVFIYLYIILREVSPFDVETPDCDLLYILLLIYNHDLEFYLITMRINYTHFGLHELCAAGRLVLATT